MLFDVRMCSFVILLALFPLCFAAPDVLGREYYRNRFRDEDVDQGLVDGRACLQECQANVHGEFNLSTSSRPRDFREYCELWTKLGECLDKCPESPASPLVKQNAEIKAQICGKDFDEPKFEELRQAQKILFEHWSWQAMASCPRPQYDASRMFDKCSAFLDCFFGEALTAVKDGYDDLVVASVVVPAKLEYALKIDGGMWTEEVVDECSVLFTPFEANHTDPSSLAAPACLRYCQMTVPAKFGGKAQSQRRADKALYCEYNRALDDCLGRCQTSPITPIVEQNALVTAHVCAPNFGEEQLRAFFDGQARLMDKWFAQAERSCGKVPVDSMEQIFEKCSVYLNCFFGEAVDAMKGADYDDLVVVAVAGQFQLQFAPMVGRGVWSKDVVDE
ncbi:hypothetical protein AAVH_07628 [Aphelenchoides avenae]|nr:hypothetical protein AAVH_07628 [Aphelenchus avenae]